MATTTTTASPIIPSSIDKIISYRVFQLSDWCHTVGYCCKEVQCPSTAKDHDYRYASHKSSSKINMEGPNSSNKCSTEGKKAPYKSNSHLQPTLKVIKGQSLQFLLYLTCPIKSNWTFYWVFGTINIIWWNCKLVKFRLLKIILYV